MSVKFENYSIQVKAAINATAVAFLHEACGELEAQVKRNTKVDTGKTKGSWEYAVDEKKLEGHIGSNYENAIWEEFGTGEYALNGDGRKGGWKYQDERGQWHYTRGKEPRRALFHAFNEKKAQIIRAAEERFRGLSDG
jgi:Bacteriophage HK97-gp10, putative tail-component